MGANDLYNVLTKYFKRLSQFGYMNDNDVYNIIVLTYIYELNKTELSIDQQGIINKALSCLRGTCYFPYSSCKGTCV